MLAQAFTRAQAVARPQVVLRTPLQLAAALSLLLVACGEDAGTSDEAATPDQAATPDEAESAMTTTDSGLRYEVLREGSGARPLSGQRVLVHYRGTLPDGTQFDSSYDRGEPAEFAVDGVIAGFSEALKLMSPGGHMRAYIPSELGYGEQGAGGLIGPDQDLVFEIELIEVR